MSGSQIVDFLATGEDEWEQACCDSFVPLSVGEVTEGFHGSLRTAFLPDGVNIAGATSGGSTIFRGKRLISAEPRDNILLSYYQSGSGSVQQHGRRAELGANSGAFYYSETPYELGLAPMRQVVIQIDRRSLHLSDHDIRNLTARRMDDSSSPSLRILARIADELLVEDRTAIDHSEFETISHAVLVLLRGLSDSILTSSGEGAVGPFAESRMLSRQAALTFIDRHFANVELTPRRVASSLHMSRRHLYDVLDDIGVTPSGYIRERRLERAAELVAGGYSVEAAMRKSGFTSISTFRRAFKERYGCVPSEYASRGEPERNG